MNILFNGKEEKNQNVNVSQEEAYHFNTDDSEGQLALDVYHTADDVVVKAPIAGVTLSDVSITIADGVLTVRGERKLEKDVPDADYYLQECYWGSFSRSIILPKNLKTEQIKAFFKNGILTVTIPKEESVKIRTIPINIATSANPVKK